MLTVSATPTPLRDTVTGFSSGSLDGMLELLEKLPDVVGEKRYVTVHVEVGARVCPEQLSVNLLNGVEGVVMVPIMRLASPSFLTNSCLSEVPPMFTLPKGTGLGVTEISE